MKLTIVGGGGFRVPLVYGALLARRDTLPFDEVVLHDLDPARMERMRGVLEGLAAERGATLPFRATTDLAERERVALGQQGPVHERDPEPAAADDRELHAGDRRGHMGISRERVLTPSP